MEGALIALVLLLVGGGAWLLARAQGAKAIKEAQADAGIAKAGEQAAKMPDVEAISAAEKLLRARRAERSKR